MSNSLVDFAVEVGDEDGEPMDKPNVDVPWLNATGSAQGY